MDQVKLHALYIVKNTLMAKWYQEGQFTLISAEEYADRLSTLFVIYILTLYCNVLLGEHLKIIHSLQIGLWGWWGVQDLIDDKLDELDAHQGDLCDYLNGKAVRKFID